ncbi:AMP-binding protein [Albimonas sp. CAU 1670]|uniref:AMP-binding protein n=1 Tax=Albimonas sp. CAU 1670 TaxID=3032599 RepID=UPI0023D9C4E3|nr:AMP-binding protein [Albimonas sp. CAU 1670]MDF2231620.1 AMP-binding protein [Albimonas sp. CAU 1670]
MTPAGDGIDPNAAPRGEAMEIVSLEGLNSVAFVEAAFALYDSGTVFSITRPGIDLGAYPQLRVAREVPAAQVSGWGRIAHVPQVSDAPAQIVFTSGTEGTPKPIVLSHRNLADVVARLNAAMGVTDEIREYIGVPVTYSFGLGRARAVSAAGGAFYLPERFDPSEIRAMLEAGEINAISAVPSLWRMVLAAPEAIGAAGEAVRWIEIGSQQMSGEEKAAMLRLFPNARIVQHYGLTEASRTTFLILNDVAPEALESVGAPTGSVQVAIGAEGAIRIRGDHVATGILGEDGRVRPLVDADGWLTTKDRGEIGPDGLLRYLGRLDDQINVAGIKLAAESLEAEIGALVGLPGRFAVAAVPDPVRGDAVLLALTEGLGAKAELVEAAARVALSDRGLAQGGLLRVMTVEALPLTDTGKVRRKALRERYIERGAASVGAAPQAAAAAPSAALGSESETRVAESWRRVVGPAEIGPESGFYDVGGDSLSAVQIGLTMESAGFPRAAVRATLEGRPLREVARLADRGAAEGVVPPRVQALPMRTIESWSINAVRGVMVLTVLVSHWGPGLFARLGLEEQAGSLLALIYRMGTPGFAAVFGLGLGFFMLPGYRENRTAVRRRLRSALWVVMAGLLVLAAAHLGRLAAEGKPIGQLQVSIAFYNVLAFYVLALATAGLWLEGMSRVRAPIATAIGISAALWVVSRFAFEAATGPHLDSLLDWPRMMLAGGGYAYPRVASSAFLGLALGIWLSRREDMGATARRLTLGGLGGVASSVLVGWDVWGPEAFQTRGAPFFDSYLQVVFCASVAAGLLGLFMTSVQGWPTLSRPVRGGFQALMVIGGLALPIYAFHGSVIPVRDILWTLGVPAPLPIALGAFLLIMGYAGFRLHRMYFR